MIAETQNVQTDVKFYLYYSINIETKLNNNFNHALSSTLIKLKNDTNNIKSMRGW